MPVIGTFTILSMHFAVGDGDQLVRSAVSGSGYVLATFVSHNEVRILACCWLCSSRLLLAVLCHTSCGSALSRRGSPCYQLWVRSFRPLWVRSFGFLSLGPSFTESADFTQVLVGADVGCLALLSVCPSFVTLCAKFSWHSMSCLANCSPMHVLIHVSSSARYE